MVEEVAANEAQSKKAAKKLAAKAEKASKVRSKCEAFQNFTIIL